LFISIKGFILRYINKTKTNIMKSFLDITNEIIKERNLEYSPKAFNDIMNEVKSTPKYIEHNNKRNEWLSSRNTNTKDYLVSFMANTLTTDVRLK